MNTIGEQIKAITGREVDFIETTFKGKKGFVPVYINHNIRERVSDLMADSKEEAEEKFLAFLKLSIPGDTDEPEPSSDTEP